MNEKIAMNKLLLLLLALTACSPSVPKPEKDTILSGTIANVSKKGIAIDNGTRTSFITIPQADRAALKKLSKGDKVTLLGKTYPSKNGTKNFEADIDEIVLSNGTRITLSQ